MKKTHYRVGKISQGVNVASVTKISNTACGIPLSTSKEWEPPKWYSRRSWLEVAIAAFINSDGDVETDGEPTCQRCYGPFFT